MYYTSSGNPEDIYCRYYLCNNIIYYFTGLKSENYGDQNYASPSAGFKSTI
jgi:hypothetical protein